MIDVIWDGGKIPFAEAQAKAEEAERLAKGLSLTTSRERSFYDDEWTETVPNWFGIAMLIDRVHASIAKAEGRTE